MNGAQVSITGDRKAAGGEVYIEKKSRYGRSVTFLIRTHVSTNCKQAARAVKPP